VPEMQQRQSDVTANVVKKLTEGGVLGRPGANAAVISRPGLEQRMHLEHAQVQHPPVEVKTALEEQLNLNIVMMNAVRRQTADGQTGHLGVIVIVTERRVLG